MKKNLILTGMMGVGKSTIGKNVAKKLKLKFIDMDRIIEKREKKKIKEIFSDKGEVYFRKIEKKLTLIQIEKKNLVIALGGGAFMNAAVRNRIKKTCLSIWLDLSLMSLLPRLKKSVKRPLLDQEDLEQSINKIYSDRKRFYNQSNFKISCDNLNIKEIVGKITKIYENSRN